jgi:hypothetical protein
MTSEKPKLRKQNHLELAQIKRKFDNCPSQKTTAILFPVWKFNIEGGGDDAASNPSITLRTYQAEISAVNRRSQNKNSSHQLTDFVAERYRTFPSTLANSPVSWSG